MREEKFKRLVGAALEDFLKTGSGEALVGNIVLRALRQHFSGYELEMETTHPDGTTERFTRTGDPLALICQWIKNTEGAIRGCQSDAAQARNRSGQARDASVQAAAALIQLAHKVGPGAAAVVEITQPAARLDSGPAPDRRSTA